jgi:hypothetical protein
MTSRGAEKMQNDTIGVDVSKDHLDVPNGSDNRNWFRNGRFWRVPPLAPTATFWRAPPVQAHLGNACFGSS